MKIDYQLTKEKMKDVKYEELTAILIDFSKLIRKSYHWDGEHISTANEIIRWADIHDEN